MARGRKPLIALSEAKHIAEKRGEEGNITPLAPDQPPLEDGGACDAPEFPVREISAFFKKQVIRHNRYRGLPTRRGRSPQERQENCQMNPTANENQTLIFP
jgi:hypothetical protein